MTIAAESHTVRANLFEREAIWRLGPDALEREQEGVTARFPYSGIVELRLAFAPTRFDMVRHRCELQLAVGGTIAIPSTHFTGIGNFEDRAASYVRFVRALVARVAAANPACRFWSGKRPAAYLAEHLFPLAMVMLLILVFGMVGGVALSYLVMIKLVVIAFFIPVAIRYARKNWPQPFRPDAIPAEALPGG